VQTEEYRFFTDDHETQKVFYSKSDLIARYMGLDFDFVDFNGFSFVNEKKRIII
jgi:hypothetical protein